MAGKWFLPRWWLYRPIMRLAHQFNWHWMPPSFVDTEPVLWCTWCGVRYRKPELPADAIFERQITHHLSDSMCRGECNDDFAEYGHASGCSALSANEGAK